MEPTADRTLSQRDQIMGWAPGTKVNFTWKINVQEQQAADWQHQVILPHQLLIKSESLFWIQHMSYETQKKKVKKVGNIKYLISHTEANIRIAQNLYRLKFSCSNSSTIWGLSLFRYIVTALPDPSSAQLDFRSS